MPPTMQIKRGSAAALASVNPTPLAGELVWDSTNNTLRVGNGSTAYSSLAIVSATPSSHTHAASDITSGTLDAARIANDSITYAKLQNVSATDRLLGRSSAGSGDVEEITCTAFGRSLIDDADAAAARTTLSVQPTASPAFTGAATFGNTGNVVPLTVTNTGTANSFVVNDASGDTTPFVIDASGNVGIGTSSPAAALDVGSGNLRFSSTAQRITGDFSNSTISNRLMFQTSTSNGNTSVRCIPNGTATVSNFVAHNGSDSNNTSFIALQASLTETIVNSGATGTGTYLPLTFYTNNAPQVQISTSGQLLVTAGSASAPGVAFSGDTNTGIAQLSAAGADTISLVTAGSERLRISSTGAVGISTDPVSGFPLAVFSFATSDANKATLLLNGTVGSGQSFAGVRFTHNVFSTGWAADILCVDTGNFGGILSFRTSAAGSATATPTERVRVGSNGRVQFFANSEKFGVQLNNGSTGNGPFIGSDGADIFTISTSGGAERVRVDASGNVGIGAAPGTTLDIQRASADAAVFVQGQTASTGATVQMYSGAGIAYIGNRTNHPLVITTNNTERVRVSAAGNVGIGISPSTLLHLNSLGVLRLQTGSVTMDCTPTAGATDSFVWNTSANASYRWSMNGTERMRIDASGNVGIGAAPSDKFHVEQSSGFATIILKASASVVSRINFQTTTNSNGYINYDTGAFRFFTDSAGAATERVQIASDGKLYAFNTYGTTVGGTNRDLFIDSGGLIGYVSSIRASKTNITAIDDVSWLRDLTPVSFHYRKRNEDGTYSDEADGTLDYGLIAEDVEPVAPEMCFYDVVDGEPQLRGVHYSKLITPMLRYIQQLEARIAALEERNHA